MATYEDTRYRFPGIKSSDNILFDTASKGIYLGVTSATASNLLDDYEEGTWTPTIDSVSGFTATTENPDYATYTKIGNTVYIRGKMNLPDSSGTVIAGDYMYISGLPFVPTVQDTAIMCAYRFQNANNASAWVSNATSTTYIRWVVNYVLGSPTRAGGSASFNFSYITDA